MVRKYWSRVKSKATNAISKSYSSLPNEKGLDGYALLSLKLTKHILLLLIQCWFYFLSTALFGRFFSQIYSTISQGLQQNSGFTLKTSFSGFLGSSCGNSLPLCLASPSVRNYRLHIHFAHVSFMTTPSSLIACFSFLSKITFAEAFHFCCHTPPFFFHQGISFPSWRLRQIESCHEGTLPLFGSGLFLSLLVQSLSPTLNLPVFSFIFKLYNFFISLSPMCSVSLQTCMGMITNNHATEAILGYFKITFPTELSLFFFFNLVSGKILEQG